MRVSKNLNMNLPERNDSVRVLENITENLEIIDENLERTTSKEMQELVEKYKIKEE